MSAASYLEKQSPLVLAGAAVAVLLLVYYLAKKTIGAVVDTAGGVVSGNNPLTAGTPYAGAGVAGTLGAGVNVASGGFFESVGSHIGGWIYDLTHLDATPAPTPIMLSPAPATGSTWNTTPWGG
jgi:hypothetical protein